MKIFNSLDEFAKVKENNVIAIGAFDGIHAGHKKVIETAREIALNRNATTAVLTFSNHPLSVIAPECEPEHIYEREERNILLRKEKVDFLIEIPFTKELAKKTAIDFVSLIKEKAMPEAIVVGENFTFGKNAEGNSNMLQKLAKREGIEAKVAETQTVNGITVSSTEIRRLIKKGDLKTVRDFLGEDYFFCGEVVKGEERGRLLGFPTANILFPEKKTILPDGVYAVKVYFDENYSCAVANIGTNPTFGDEKRRLEVHILDFSGDLYGKTMRVIFVERLRGEEKFSSVEELTAQIKKDKENSRKILFT